MKWVSVCVFAAFSTLSAHQAAAEASSFYTDMLHRGVVTYEKGQLPRAADQLRIAAFGLVDDIPQYETAQLYLILIGDKLHHPEDARQAAQKLAAAERIQTSYMSLPVDSSVRRGVEQLLPTLLTAEELATVPSLSAIAVRGTKNWNEVADLYSDVRTHRRLTNEEDGALLSAFVQSGRLNDAAGLRALLPPAVVSSPSLASTLARVPAQIPGATSSPAPPTGGDAASQLAEGEKALGEARFGAARQIYLRLSQQTALSRTTALAVARGLHRVSALKESTALYQRLYPLKAGEEQHMFAEAVNRYELGDLPTARVLVGRALSGLTRTPEVSFYLPRLESGR